MFSHIFQMTQIVRQASVHKSQGQLADVFFKVTYFGDIIAADHNVLIEGESRSNQRYAIVVQDLAS